MEPQRAAATLRLPGTKSHAAVCSLTEPPAPDGGGSGGGGGGPAGALHLAVASAEGILYSYRLEGLTEGGGSIRHTLQGEWRLVGV